MKYRLLDAPEPRARKPGTRVKRKRRYRRTVRKVKGGDCCEVKGSASTAWKTIRKRSIKRVRRVKK